MFFSFFSWRDIKDFKQTLRKRLVRWPEEIRELKQQRRQKREFALLQTLSLLISSRLRISNPKNPSKRIHRIKHLFLDSMKGTQPYYSIVWDIIERYSYAFFSCSGHSWLFLKAYFVSIMSLKLGVTPKGKIQVNTQTALEGKEDKGWRHLTKWCEKGC